MNKIVEFRPKSVPARIREAARTQALIRVFRWRLGSRSFTGYVATFGKDQFLLWALGDYIGFDDYFILHYADLTKLEVPDQHACFLERVLKLRRLESTFPKQFPLDDWRMSLRTFTELAQVISIYVDIEVENKVCYIGKLLSLGSDGFSVQEISPHAEWLQEAPTFGWEELSAVSMHEPYALAWFEVAGEPPSLDRSISEPSTVQ